MPKATKPPGRPRKRAASASKAFAIDIRALVHDDESKRRWNAEMVRLREENYRREGKNPLDVWVALLACLEMRTLPPDWVREYFLEVGSALLGVLNAYDTPGRTPPSDLWGAVAEALQFKKPGRSGRGSVFQKYRNRTKAWFLGETVEFYMRQGDKELHAVEDVARRNGVSAATVRRALRLYRDVLKR